jgi:hypothetical protein
MDELDEDELFTVCLDDDGHPVQRAVRDMPAGEVIAAIDHLTVGSTRIEAREKLARLRQVVAQKHPMTEVKPSGPRAAPGYGRCWPDGRAVSLVGIFQRCRCV